MPAAVAVAVKVPTTAPLGSDSSHTKPLNVPTSEDGSALTTMVTVATPVFLAAPDPEVAVNVTV